MRDLTTERNIIRIADAISGSEIEIYYKTPAPEQIQGYLSKMIQKKGNKVKMNIAETRLEFGMKIITGFREGDFGCDGKPLSSDPNSPNYREDWKELIKNSAPDIVMLVAQTVFEGARVAKDTDEIEFEEEENILPLEKS